MVLGQGYIVFGNALNIMNLSIKVLLYDVLLHAQKLHMCVMVNI